MNISLQNHAALDRVMFVYLVRSAEPKTVGKWRLLTITVLWTQSVSHSFVAILDLLIVLEETVSLLGLHCQACLEISKDWVHYQWIFYIILFYLLVLHTVEWIFFAPHSKDWHQYLSIYMLLGNFVAEVLSSFSLSSLYHSFHCLSGIANEASLSFNCHLHRIYKMFFYCITNAMPLPSLLWQWRFYQNEMLCQHIMINLMA